MLNEPSFSLEINRFEDTFHQRDDNHVKWEEVEAVVGKIRFVFQISSFSLFCFVIIFKFVTVQHETGCV